jgi:hypothetical protein
MFIYSKYETKNYGIMKCKLQIIKILFNASN